MPRGILHAHSDHSFDAFESILKIADWAKEEALDFVVLTEHDNFFSQSQYESYLEDCKSVSRTKNISIIPGIEYSFGPKRRIHINVIGLSHFIAVETYNNDIKKFVTDVQNLGAIAILNHPLNIINDVPLDVLVQFDAMEVWNTKYDHMYAPSQDSKNWFSKVRTASGYETKAIVASDIHHYPPKRYAVLDIECSVGQITPQRLINAVKFAKYTARFDGWTVSPNGKFTSKNIFQRVMLPRVSALHNRVYFSLRSIARKVKYKPPSWIVNWLKFRN